MSGNNEDKPPAPSTITPLRARNEQNELERINRVTGLDFDAVPTSLISKPGGLQLTQDDGEELIYRALYLWSDKPPAEK